jgi:hypothetical protein
MEKDLSVLGVKTAEAETELQGDYKLCEHFRRILSLCRALVARIEITSHACVQIRLFYCSFQWCASNTCMAITDQLRATRTRRLITALTTARHRSLS